MILFLMLFDAAQRAESADIYIAQNASGSDTGADCANAHSVNWFNSNAVGGNTYHLCGIFIGTAGSTMLTPPSGEAGSILTVLFEPGAMLVAPYWGNISAGAINISQKSYIKIDGGISGIIKNSSNGTNLSNHSYSQGIYVASSSNVEIANLTIEDMYVNNGSDPNATDISGAMTANICLNGRNNNISIHNCDLRSARSGILFDFGGSAIFNVSIYDNYIADHCWGINMGAGNGNEYTDNIHIYNNEITDWSNWACPGGSVNGCCKSGIDFYHTDGMIFYQPSTNTDAFEPYIYDNYLHGSLGGGSSTAFIYCTYGGISGGNNGSSCKIYNNLIVMDSRIDIYRNWGISTGGFTSGHEIYSNTIIGKTAATGDCMMLSGVSTRVKNNICQNFRSGISSYSTDFLAEGHIIDNNLYWNIYNGQSGTMFHQNEASPRSPLDFWSWPQWQADGFDRDSYYENPNLSASYNLQVNSGNAIDNGAVLYPPYNIDRLGVKRPQGKGWDIGAYEYVEGGGNTIAPGVPLGLSVR